MNNYRRMTVASALVVAGFLAVAPSLKARIVGADSEEISKLLADAKAEAVELKSDAEDMESFTNSQLHWRSYATKVEMIKEHVNKTGGLVAKMEAVKHEGSVWQQKAIEQIKPLLTELAANAQTTIKYLKENPTRVHMSEFRDYVRANYELSRDLEALIRDFVDYDNAKQELARLGDKLEVTE